MLESFGNRVIVRNLDTGSQVTKGGIVLRDTNGKKEGIMPRWCQVFKTGSLVDDLKENDWVLVSHGRWSYGFDDEDDSKNKETFWIIDYPEHVLVKVDKKPDNIEVMPKYKD